jgi:hypothetical protein
MAIGCLSAVRAIECGYSHAAAPTGPRDTPRIVDAARKLKARSFMIRWGSCLVRHRWGFRLRQAPLTGLQ